MEVGQGYPHSACPPNTPQSLQVQFPSKRQQSSPTSLLWSTECLRKQEFRVLGPVLFAKGWQCSVIKLRGQHCACCFCKQNLYRQQYCKECCTATGPSDRTVKPLHLHLTVFTMGSSWRLNQVTRQKIWCLARIGPPPIYSNQRRS